MSLLITLPIIAIVLIALVKWYADRNIGDSASFETDVEELCISAQQQHSQAFGSMPEVSNDEELILETHNATGYEGRQAPVLVQSTVPSLNGDEGHSGSSDEGLGKASAPTGLDKGPKADESDRRPVNATGSNDTGSDDVNLKQGTGS